MRHRKSGRKLGRNAAHRKAMFRNMATSLIHEGKIQTTITKAKELRPIIEKLITLAKNNLEGKVEPIVRVNAIRQAGKFIRSREALHTLFSEIGERYVDRPGGYTRIIRIGHRLGDNAELAIIEFVADDDAFSTAHEESEALTPEVVEA
jgi:large subunit ribosomal protein L17